MKVDNNVWLTKFCCVYVLLCYYFVLGNAETREKFSKVVQISPTFRIKTKIMNFVRFRETAVDWTNYTSHLIGGFNNTSSAIGCAKQCIIFDGCIAFLFHSMNYTEFNQCKLINKLFPKSSFGYKRTMGLLYC